MYVYVVVYVHVMVYIHVHIMVYVYVVSGICRCTYDLKFSIL